MLIFEKNIRYFLFINLIQFFKIIKSALNLNFKIILFFKILLLVTEILRALITLSVWLVKKGFFISLKLLIKIMKLKIIELGK